MTYYVEITKPFNIAGFDYSVSKHDKDRDELSPDMVCFYRVDGAENRTDAIAQIMVSNVHPSPNVRKIFG